MLNHQSQREKEIEKFKMQKTSEKGKIPVKTKEHVYMCACVRAMCSSAR